MNWIETCSGQGQALMFNQKLPKGNRTNREQETHRSMNYRFKSVASSGGEKFPGEFLKPITLRPASRRGEKYRYLVIED